MKTRDLETALRIFHEKGGTVRTRDLIALGVHTDALYALRAGRGGIKLGTPKGTLEHVGEDFDAPLPDAALPGFDSGSLEP